jgi:hypothetical protein
MGVHANPMSSIELGSNASDAGEASDGAFEV